MPDQHEGPAALRAGRGAASRRRVRSAALPLDPPLPSAGGGIGGISGAGRMIHGLPRQDWYQNPATRSSAW